MTVIEIVLLIVGMLFILGSFWVTEKLSPEELEHIAELSKEEMGVMLEHELDRSKQKVVDLVEETIDASKDRTERSLEKQTNEKIMAINEYSDTVIEKMNKTHNEIMFLYSMLNDKHTELTSFSSEITQQIEDLKQQEEELTNYYIGQLKQQKPQAVKAPAPAAAPRPAVRAAQTLQGTKSTQNAQGAKTPQNAQEAKVSQAVQSAKSAQAVQGTKASQAVQSAKSAQAPQNTKAAQNLPDTNAGQDLQSTETEQDLLRAAETAAEEQVQAEAEAYVDADFASETEEEINVRDEILRLYEEGKDSVAIAKKLGMGVGEVRLILGLYKGDN